MTRNLILLMSLSLCFGSIAWAQTTPAVPGPPKLETEEQRTLYALGLLLGRNLKPFALKAEELEIVKAGLSDVVTGALPQLELDEYGPKVNALAQKRVAAAAEEGRKKGEEFLENVARQKDASKTPSGIVIRIITPGSGESPGPTDLVRVHYEGKLINGTIFDSSIQRGQPAEFPLNEVVPCWREAMQRMKKGEKSQIVCPSSMAYGERGSPPLIPPGATLSFEVELIDFRKQ